MTSYWEDIVGLEIYVTNVSEQMDNTEKCPTTVDGSGYYDCVLSGRYLILKKPSDGANESFTLCGVDFYTMYNLMSIFSPTITTNLAVIESGFEVDKFANHPIGYSFSDSDYSFSTIATVLDNDSDEIIITFDIEVPVELIIIDICQDASTCSQQLGFEYKIK